MFLHLGENTVITTNEIIGIFDMDNTTVSKITRDYLSSMQKNKRIVDVSFDLPKSFILCKNKETGEDTVYISPISTQTLLKRIQTNKGFEWDCQFKTVLFFKDYVFAYYVNQKINFSFCRPKHEPVKTFWFYGVYIKPFKSLPYNRKLCYLFHHRIFMFFIAHIYF